MSTNYKRKARDYSYTLLRPTLPAMLLINKLGLDYHIAGYEIGSKSKIPHIQGYFSLLEYDIPFRIKHILKGYYVAPAKKSIEVNQLYCKKSGLWIEYQNLFWKDDLDNQTKQFYNSF